MSDNDGACENVGSMLGATEGLAPLFGAGDMVGAGEMVGNTDIVGSDDGRIDGSTEGPLELLGSSVTVDGLKLVVGAILGFGLFVGAFESVGSKVSTFVGTLLIVGAGLPDGGKLGGKVVEGVNDGEPDGISVTSIPVLGKRDGTGDTLGLGEEIVGCADTAGSSVSGGSINDGGNVTMGLELGKIDSMA